MELVITASEQTELIPKGKIDAQKMFVYGEGLDEMLNAIKEEVYSFGQDVSDKNGREIVKSTAYKISRSKTFLDDTGKSVVVEEKKKVDAANANRKKVKVFLDDLKGKYREPLTDWELEEKKREEEEAEKEKTKIDGRMDLLLSYCSKLTYSVVAMMTDEDFDEMLKVEKFVFDEKKRKADEEALAEKKEKEDAEAKRKADTEALEKEKKNIREQRKEIRTHDLKKIGFEFKNDFFSYGLPGGKGIIISLNDVIDLEPADFNISIAGWKKQIADAEKVEDEQPETEMDQTDTAPEQTEKEPNRTYGIPLSKIPELSESSIDAVSKIGKEIDDDIADITNWMINIGITVNSPVDVMTPHAQAIVLDIRDAFNAFIGKINDSWMKELS